MPAVRFAYSQSAVIAALFVCAFLGFDAWLTLATVCVVTVRYAARLPYPFAVVLGLVAWAFFTGFVTNTYGVLTFTDADLTRLMLLVALGATAHWTR
jgi:hypothetical protein